ncbi:MAG: type VI secretion system Vgr family protein, partial [Gemmataceae bacterium]
MSDYSQAERNIRISTPLGKDVLLLAGLMGREGLSQLFCFTVQLATAGDPVAFDEILGQPVSIAQTLPDGVQRNYHGIVSRFRQTGRDKTFVYYEADIVPRLWLLTRSRRSRIFQRQSVPDILKELFQALRPDVQFRLSGSYPRREYCVQYAETDFAFASRIMEEEGIYYFFEHEADKHTLVVTDSPQGCQLLAQAAKVVFDDAQNPSRDYLRVTSWAKQQILAASKFSLWDHHFELPDQNLAATREIAASAQVGTVEHKLKLTQQEHQDYPGGCAKWFDGIGPDGQDQADQLNAISTENERLARLESEREIPQALAIDAASNCGHFSAGRRFQLDQHFDGNGEYVLTEVEHEVEANFQFRSTGQKQVLAYSNRFRCLPAALTYRPARQTPRPIIAGTQTARVVGLSDDEVFVDKYGRVKVQFHWDRQGQKDSRSSCWLRVGQIWAGKNWGAFFWPRVGHEVIVSFQEGDPDRPLVVGSVYNASNMPPLDLPDASSSCGIKSCTVGGDSSEQFNCVIFHDMEDKEHLEIHSENYAQFTSETAGFNNVPGPVVQIGGVSLSDLGSGSGSGSGQELGSGMGAGLASVGTLIGVNTNKGWREHVGSHVFPGKYESIGGDVVNAVVGGANYDHIMGPTYSLQFNPETLLGYGLNLGSAKLAEGTSFYFDLNELVVGSRVELEYCLPKIGGPVLNVTRGEKIEFSEPVLGTGGDYQDAAVKAAAASAATAVAAIAGFMALSTTVGHIVFRILYGGSTTKSTAPPYANVAFMNAYTVCAWMLNFVESKFGALLKSKSLLDAAEILVKDSVKALEDGTVKSVSDRLSVAETDLSQAKTDLEDLTKTLAEENSSYPGNKTFTYSGNFMLKANKLEFQNADSSNQGYLAVTDSGEAKMMATAVELTAGPALTSVTMRDKNISVKADAGGTLQLTAAGTVSQPSIKIADASSEGTISLDAGNVGTITLSAGLATNPATLKLSKSGMEFSFGLGSISLGADDLKFTLGDR